jgi:hypothetical protein
MCTHDHDDMHGHERSVERKIRLWVVQQERNLRKDGQSSRIKAHNDTPAVRRRRAIDTRQR